jgi:uncharacterized protein YkwD
MPDELRPSACQAIVAAARKRAKLWAVAAVTSSLLAALVGYALTPGGTSAHAAASEALTRAPASPLEWTQADTTAATALARFIEDSAKPSPTATITPAPTLTATPVPPSATATTKPRPQLTVTPRPAVVAQEPPPAQPTATPAPRGPWGLDTSPMDAYSQTLFDDTNQRRVASGLAPLRANGWLIGVARIRSQDMADHDYFAHVSPITGDTAFTLMDKHGVPYGWAGENLAKNNYPDDQTVSVADNALWNSQPHRENILNPNYTDMGIALVVDGSGMKYFTIVFIGPP